jgi:hypothetical protein
MKRPITTADVKAALDGFIQAGLAREFSADGPSCNTSNSSSHLAKRKRKHSRFSKRERVLIKKVVEKFCPRFAPGATVVYKGDTENKFVHLKTDSLSVLGVTLDSAAKIPDVIVHYTAKNWLLLIEAATSAGPVDGKRRKELKDLFAGCKAGLVFVTAFETRRAMQSFISQIAWESEVWIAEDPDHMIHFNGERFLGPYPDVTAP